MRNNVADLLTSVDDLFTTQETRDKANLEHIVLLSPEEISDYPNHPFQVRMDEEMEQMTESVKEHGVLVPVLVRPKPEGGYEMVAGHRRKCAAKQAGLSGIPCIVRPLTDDEAVIVMVDSNLQREKVLPSERAFAYKMRMEVMERRQGQRNDLTSANDLQKLAQRQTSRDKVAEKAGKSHETIRLYICLYTESGRSSTIAGLTNSAAYLGSALSGWGLGFAAGNWGWECVNGLLLALCLLGFVVSFAASLPWRRFIDKKRCPNREN